MSELEFTGERVIPGLVDSNLYNEHFARYRFATQFVSGKRVLDAGCGTGYGVAEISQCARFAVGVDFSMDALRHARENFPGPLHVQSRCERFPFADGAFDVVTAFEVIEHLEEWGTLIAEARRTLTPHGLFLVSTPNKSYYAETRETSGPNPFHAHEFEFHEFKDALRWYFPHVEILLQNHTEAISFAGGGQETGTLETSQEALPSEAHFYLAVCSAAPLPEIRPFAWIPETANLLRTREHHIALLDGELAQKSTWLGQLEQDHASLQAEHETVLADLRRVNEWSAQLSKELEASKLWGKGLEDHLTAAREVVAARDAEIALRNQWVSRLKEEVEERNRTITKWSETHARLLAESTAAQLEAAAEISRLEAELAVVHSRAAGLIAEVKHSAAVAAAGYEAAVNKVDEEIVQLHSDYQRRIAQLESESQNMAAAYEGLLAGLHAEKARVHEVYEAVIEALERKLAEAATGRKEVEAELDRIRSDRDRILTLVEAASNAKWLKLGRKLNLGPNLESL